jgi:hypothetical protein
MATEPVSHDVLEFVPHTPHCDERLTWSDHADCSSLAVPLAAFCAGPARVSWSASYLRFFSHGACRAPDSGNRPAPNRTHSNFLKEAIMSWSTIYVEYDDGSPAAGARVGLGFSSGVTGAYIANRHGVAEVEHESSGQATIFVNGRRCGSMYAPGEASITL